MARRQIGAWLALAAFVAPGLAVAQSADCHPPALGHVPFSYGEKIEYDVDVLGARLGSLVLAVHPGPPPDAYSITARAQTDSLAGDFYSADAVGESHLGSALEDHSLEEEGAEGGIHRSALTKLPPHNGWLAVSATREGSPADFSLQAPPETVDMLAVLYQLRTLPLPAGASFCFPVLAGRHLVLLRAAVAGREMVRTPGGDYQSIHLSGTADRVDGTPTQAREVHLWLSDDADRIPVMAMGLVQGKPLSLRMMRYTPGVHRHH